MAPCDISPTPGSNYQMKYHTNSFDFVDAQQLIFETDCL